MFDVSDRKSFENLEDNFINVFNLNCKNENSILYIIGNKSDKSPREVTEDEARGLADSYNYKYFETSAKTGTNVDVIFQSAMEQVV